MGRWSFRENRLIRAYFEVMDYDDDRVKFIKLDISAGGNYTIRWVTELCGKPF
jgi:hypothetical protein